MAKTVRFLATKHYFVPLQLSAVAYILPDALAAAVVVVLVSDVSETSNEHQLCKFFETVSSTGNKQNTMQMNKASDR